MMPNYIYRVEIGDGVATATQNRLWIGQEQGAWKAGRDCAKAVGRHWSEHGIVVILPGPGESNRNTIRFKFKDRARFDGFIAEWRFHLQLDPDWPFNVVAPEAADPETVCENCHALRSQLERLGHVLDAFKASRNDLIAILASLPADIHAAVERQRTSLTSDAVSRLKTMDDA